MQYPAPSTTDNNGINLRQQLEYVAVSRATDTVTVIANDANVKKEDTPLNHIKEQKQPSQTEIGPETKINIYAGTNENADLSNFAIRPFTIKGSVIGAQDSIGNYVFDSVEHAFQAAKTMYSDTEDRQEWFDNIQKAKTPAEARALGRKIPQLDREDWDIYSSEIMKDLIKASFEQNPQAIQRLLSTDTATLTHTQGTGKWKTEFPKLLMEVREELRKQTSTLPSAKSNLTDSKSQLSEKETNSSFCRMRHPSNADSQRCFEQFKRFSV